jgi:uncharacterized protein
MLIIFSYCLNNIGYFTALGVKMTELSSDLLEVLACSKCKGDLDYLKKECKLICKKCKLAYRVENGIPLMLLEEAEQL